MTSVNVTTTEATVSVTEGDGVVIIATPPASAQVVVVASPSGPQGPAGPTGPQGPPGAGGGSTTLATLTDVDVTGKVDGSFLVYEEDVAKFKADNTNTVLTLTDFGNF